MLSLPVFISRSVPFPLCGNVYVFCTTVYCISLGCCSRTLPFHLQAEHNQKALLSEPLPLSCPNWRQVSFPFPFALRIQLDSRKTCETTSLSPELETRIPLMQSIACENISCKYLLNDCAYTSESVFLVYIFFFFFFCLSY
jgi:hypothetical protein